MSSNSVLSKAETFASSTLSQLLEYQKYAGNLSIVELKKHVKLGHVAVAVALLVASSIYKSLSYPKKLAHIAHVPARKNIRSFIKGETNVDRAKQLFIPLCLETKGLVAKYAQFGWEVAVISPESARTVFRNPDIFQKTESLSLLDPQTLSIRFLGSTNLALANGEDWKRRRKIANPAFHRSMPVKAFVDLTGTLLQQIDTMKGPIDVQPLLQRFTLDVIGRVGFGFEFNATRAPDGDWVHTYNEVSDNLLQFPYIFFPILDTRFRFLFPRRMEKHAKLTVLNNLFNTVIRNKRENLQKLNGEIEDSEKDLLSLLIESGRGENDNYEPLTDEELRSELVLFFFAGHDTTANSLASTLYFLAANTAIQDKARQETLELLGDEPHDASPNNEQLKNMHYLTRVIKESARMSPPASATIHRRAAQDTEISGLFIPKETLIVVDIIANHYNPAYWKNPNVFDPDRFLEGGEADQQSPFSSYMPFGGGVRQCIGMNFSLAEQRVALSAILKKYELSIPEGSIHKDSLQFGNHLFTLAPKDLAINFTKRY
ncbi:hypothetical protein K450DRAFT_240945 [Umbelopsis ramanniana AG]|uniref:Cytochrome P450 n=1 Tax=Umbelopsis ramanniana AG TaxID=1314678 RepID=A0AAD5E9K8_UMBRA|nr:uncharacterized protein K450DRAFT_240945 [Umbelopsis ramanniana AG]KAI8579668.1 hypothetical protein K450DRAFT_240945 [Umbelopsis ramanniana AG]